jgi:hypothetical protein
MLMRILIKRLSFLSSLALLAVACLNLLSGTALARSPRPMKLDIYGEFVSADPGEDPHMKTEPVNLSEELQGMDGVPPSKSNGRAEPAIMGGRRGTGRAAGAGRSRVKYKLYVTLQILFGPFYR